MFYLQNRTKNLNTRVVSGTTLRAYVVKPFLLCSILVKYRNGWHSSNEFDALSEGILFESRTDIFYL
jgi:hypothetical protein